MSNIFSNRFFQGGIAIAAIGVAFFAYQSFAGETTDNDVDAAAADISTDNSTTATTAASEGQVEAHQVYVTEDNKVENAINNDEKTNTINTADEQTIK